jgi:hypothetical protein
MTTLIVYVWQFTTGEGFGYTGVNATYETARAALLAKCADWGLIDSLDEADRGPVAVSDEHCTAADHPDNGFSYGISRLEVLP